MTDTSATPHSHWLSTPSVDLQPQLPNATVLDRFRAFTTADSSVCALRYFGQDVNRGDPDSLSDHLARVFAARGVTRS